MLLVALLALCVGGIVVAFEYTEEIESVYPNRPLNPEDPEGAWKPGGLALLLVLSVIGAGCTAIALLQVLFRRK